MRLSHASRENHGPAKSVGGHSRAPTRTAPTAPKKSPRARLVSGPTTAMAASSAGACGTCCIWDRPPIGMSRMSSTTAPRRRATKQWASSCTSTELKTATIHNRLFQNCERSLPNATRGTRSKKVQSRRMSIPKIRATRIEPLALVVFGIVRAFWIVEILKPVWDCSACGDFPHARNGRWPSRANALGGYLRGRSSMRSR